MGTMDTDRLTERQTPQVKPGIYNPVSVYAQDSLGSLILGIISIILLVGWMKAEARSRRLLSR